MKSQKFYGDSDKNESARAKKLEGGGRQTPPLPSLYRVKRTMFKSVKNFTFICTVNYNITTLPLIVKKFYSKLLIL